MMSWKGFSPNDGSHHVTNGKAARQRAGKWEQIPESKSLHIFQTIHNFVAGVIHKIRISLSSRWSWGIYDLVLLPTYKQLTEGNMKKKKGGGSCTAQGGILICGIWLSNGQLTPCLSKI